MFVVTPCSAVYPILQNFGIVAAFYIYGSFKLILNFSSIVETDSILNKLLLATFIIAEKNDC